jgi:hypothetical protein
MSILIVFGLAGCSSNSKEKPQPPSDKPPMAEAQQPTIDFATAAKALGISEQALKDALGDPQQGPPDFAAAAKILGITQEALLKALGLPTDAMPPQ